MKKIKTETRYNNMLFKFIREVKGLRMFFNEDNDYCIIVDKTDNILFEIKACYGQGIGLLDDAI